MNVPGAKEVEYLTAGWKVISRTVIGAEVVQRNVALPAGAEPEPVAEESKARKSRKAE